MFKDLKAIYERRSKQNLRGQFRSVFQIKMAPSAQLGVFSTSTLIPTVPSNLFSSLMTLSCKVDL
jgi:hypothetical protein